MSRLSVELVPRSATKLMDDLAVVRRVLPDVGMINIPELQRLELRSHVAAKLLAEQGATDVVMHVRAIDIAPDAPLPGADNPGLTSVLVVRGDPPEDASRPTWPNTSEDIIARYRRELPSVQVYAAFDPYRRAPWQELEAVARKRDAGACGFFTQPIFDHTMLRACMEWMRDETVFWGVSPVLGERAHRYWERVNHVVFPHDYPEDLAGNIKIGRDLLSTILAAGGDAYLMPVTADLPSYLGAFADIVAR